MREAGVLPVPLPDPGTLAGLPRPLGACARCGFLALRPLTHDEGAWAGSGALRSARACDRCGHEGLPLSFDGDADYLAFLEALHAGAPRTQAF